MTTLIRSRTEELALTALGELWHKNPVVHDVATLCDDCGNRFAPDRKASGSGATGCSGASPITALMACTSSHTIT